MKALKEALYLLLYRLAAARVNRLDDHGRVALARKLAKAAWYLWPAKRHVTLLNLRFAFEGKLDDARMQKIGIEAYTNFAMTLFSVIRLQNIAPEELLRSIRFKNASVVERALQEGKRIIFVTGHYGNWELISPAVTLHFGVKAAVVGRRLDSDAMESVLKKSRERFNVEVIYKRGAGKGTLKALKAGKVLGLLVDQALPKRLAAVVNFFGKKATHTPLPATLALQRDALIIPVFIHTCDHIVHTVTFHPPLSAPSNLDKAEAVQTLTQRIADITEATIRQDPSLWFWMHKRWKNFYPELYRREQNA